MRFLRMKSMVWLDAILNNHVENANAGVYRFKRLNALVNVSMVKSSASSSLNTMRLIKWKMAPS